MKLAVGATAAATIALLTPASAQAAPVAPQRAAADASFGVVAALPFAASTVTSPVDGTAYVAGVDSSGAVRVRRYVRTTTGTTSAVDVAVPTKATSGQYGPSAGVDLASGGGRTYLLVDGATPSLWELLGTTARAITLPDTDPLTGGKVKAQSIAVDSDGSLFVAFNRLISAPSQGPGRTAAHLVGGAWAWAPVEAYNPEGAVASYAADGTYFQVIGANLNTVLKSWSNGAWTALGTRGSCKSAWCFADEDFTFVSANDLTGWGWSTRYVDGRVVDPVGRCTHLVGDAASSCPAPAWPVTQAERLGDGSVVLAGSDVVASRLTAPTPGGFAVVATPGAQPVALRGDAYDATVDLAAAPTGRTVWALNRSGTQTVLQVLSPARRLPAPKPARRHLGRH